MPFLAPAAITAGASIFGSLLGKKSQDKAAQQQAAYNQQLLQLQQQQQTRSNQLFDQYAAPNLTHASDIFKQLLGTYSGLLKGDAGLQNSLLGPSRDARAGALQQQTKQLAEFSPRGGMQSSLLGNARMSTLGDNARDLLGLKATSLDKMEGLGGAFAGLGGQSASTSAGMSSSLMSNLLGMRGQDLEKQLADSQRSSQMWNQVGNIGGQLLGGWLSRRGGGSKSSSGSKGGWLDIPGITN